MQIINNYDLMTSVDLANNGVQLKKTILGALKLQLILMGLSTGIDLALRSDHEIQWLWNIAYNSMVSMSYIALVNTLQKKFKDKIETQAFLKLAKLALQLYDLNISTPPFLLQAAKVSQTEYRVQVNERHLPVIQQRKYILIPTYDSLGEIKEVSLLQEHNLGSKTYILSVASPEKAYEFAPVMGV